MPARRVLDTEEHADLLRLTREIVTTELAPLVADAERDEVFPREAFRTLGRAGLLDEIERLPLGEALTVLSHAVVTLAHEHRFLIAATAHRFDQAVRSAITDEPVTQLLRRHEQLVAPDVDLDWLARCVRSLCLVAISDTRPTAQVAGDLAASLRRLVLADPA